MRGELKPFLSSPFFCFLIPVFCDLLSLPILFLKRKNRGGGCKVSLAEYSAKVKRSRPESLGAFCEKEMRQARKN